MTMSMLSNAFSTDAEVNTAISTFLQKFESRNHVHIKGHQLEGNITKGENNFCSVISRLTFQYEEDGIEVRESVLLKIPSLSPNYDHMKLTNMYPKEVYIYETVFPHIYQLWPKDHFTPRAYGTMPESGILILQDLTKEGYKTVDKLTQLDYDHCTIALQTIAEFHAVSFKYLQDKRIEDLADFMRRGSEMGSPFRQYVNSLYDRFVETVSPSLSPSTVDKLKTFKTTFWANAKTMMSPDEIGLNVLLHGDFWTGNMLFKYDHDHRVCRTKIVDWQICRVGCPVVDIIYFFTTSPQFAVFETERETLINSYLTKFNETLAKLGCDFVYAREKLVQDMDRYKFLYINMISSALQLMFNNTGVIDRELTNQFHEMYKSLALKWLAYFEAHNIL